MSRPFAPTTTPTWGVRRLFVAIAMLCEVAVSAGETTMRAWVTDVSTKPRNVIDGVEGSLFRSDRKLRALSSKSWVMSHFL